MTRRKVVQFDIDGVLCNWHLPFTTKGNELFGTEIQQPWEVREWLPLSNMTETQYHEVWRWINQNDYDFWASCPPLLERSIYNRINYLSAEKVDIYFVTARHTPNAKAATEVWLLSQGISMPTVILCEHKAWVAELLKAEYAIEDNAENASQIATVGSGATKSYLIDRKYNRKEVDPAVRRIEVVSEFLDAIEGKVHPSRNYDMVAPVF